MKYNVDIVLLNTKLKVNTNAIDKVFNRFIIFKSLERWRCDKLQHYVVLYEVGGRVREGGLFQFVIMRWCHLLLQKYTPSSYFASFTFSREKWTN